MFLIAEITITTFCHYGFDVVYFRNFFR
ncbi:hypothetical protein CP8484711_0684, partial [Chlamydia psittaci 84-8471/1]